MSDNPLIKLHDSIVFIKITHAELTESKTKVTKLHKRITVLQREYDVACEKLLDEFGININNII